MDLLFKIDNQKLIFKNEEEFLASGSVNYLSAKFEFTNDWNGLGKTARFSRAELEEPLLVPLENNECVVPWEVLEKSGSFFVSVFGENSEKVITITSSILQLRIESGSLLNGEEPKPPTPSEYSIIITSLHNLETKFETVITEEQVDQKDSAILEQANSYTDEKVDEEANIREMADTEIQGNLDSHIADEVKHITQQERQTWEAKLDELKANPLIKEVNYDETNGLWTFTRYDNTVITFDQPIEELLSNAYYDAETKELVLVFQSGNEVRIPASGLIADFEGAETETVQVEIGYDNIITAMVKGGSITRNLLAEAVITELESKADLSYVQGEVERLQGNINLKDTLPIIPGYSVYINSSANSGKPNTGKVFGATSTNADTVVVRTSIGTIRSKDGVTDDDLITVKQLNTAKTELNTSIKNVSDAMYSPPAYETYEEAYNAVLGHKGLTVEYFE